MPTAPSSLVSRSKPLSSPKLQAGHLRTPLEVLIVPLRLHLTAMGYPPISYRLRTLPPRQHPIISLILRVLICQVSISNLQPLPTGSPRPKNSAGFAVCASMPNITNIKLFSPMSTNARIGSRMHEYEKHIKTNHISETLIPNYGYTVRRTQ